MTSFEIMSNNFQECFRGYDDCPEMHSGSKDDLYEYQAYTKERVADLESDIKKRSFKS